MRHQERENQRRPFAWAQWMAGVLLGMSVSLVTVHAESPVPSGNQDDPETMLRELSRLMQQVEQQLRQGDTSRETQQLQQQVVDQLDEWIAAFEQQQQQQQRQKEQQQEATDPEESESPEETESPEEEGRSDDASGEPDETTGDPSEEGSPSEGEGGEESRVAGEGDPGPAGRSGDSIWGHLPERIRQQLQSAAVERFHPKYEDLIEAFYRRLTEEDSRLPNRSSP